MKNLIIFMLIAICVFLYVNRNADIDYGERLRNFPNELLTFIQNMKDPDKREILTKELTRRVRRVESKLGDIQFGVDEEETEGLEQYVSIELTTGLVAEGQLLRRTNQGDFVLQLPGSQVTIAKEEVKNVRAIVGEDADVLREVIRQSEEIERGDMSTSKQKMASALGLVHRWESTIPSALEKAKRNNKIVMVEFMTTWCGWCKKLDKDTMKNSQVQAALNKYFVSVRLDGSKNKALVRKYNVRGYPNIVFLNSKGTVIMQQPGYLPPERFIELLYAIVEKVKMKQ